MSGEDEVGTSQQTPQQELHGPVDERSFSERYKSEHWPAGTIAEGEVNKGGCEGAILQRRKTNAMQPTLVNQNRNR